MLSICLMLNNFKCFPSEWSGFNLLAAGRVPSFTDEDTEAQTIKEDIWDEGT